MRSSTTSISLGHGPLCSTAAVPYGGYSADPVISGGGYSARFTPPQQPQHGGARLYPPADSPLGAAHMYAADGSSQPVSKFGLAPQRPAASAAGAMGDGRIGWGYGQVRDGGVSRLWLRTGREGSWDW